MVKTFSLCYNINIRKKKRGFITMNIEEKCIVQTVKALKSFLPDLELPAKTEDEFWQIYDDNFNGSDSEIAVHDFYEEIDYFMREIYFDSDEMADIDDKLFEEYCPQSTSDMISFIYEHKKLLK